MSPHAQPQKTTGALAFSEVLDLDQHSPLASTHDCSKDKDVSATLPKDRESEQLQPLASSPVTHTWWVTCLIIVSLIEPLLWFNLSTLLWHWADMGICPPTGPTPTVVCQFSWALIHWYPSVSSRRMVPSLTRHLPMAVQCSFLLPRKTAFHQLSEFLFIFVLSVFSTLVSLSFRMSWKWVIDGHWLQQNATIYSRSFTYLSLTQKTKQPEVARDSLHCQLKNRIKNTLIHLLHDRRTRIWLLSFLLWESHILYPFPCLVPSKPSVVVTQNKSFDQVQKTGLKIRVMDSIVHTNVKVTAPIMCQAWMLYL